MKKKLPFLISYLWVFLDLFVSTLAFAFLLQNLYSSNKEANLDSTLDAARTKTVSVLDVLTAFLNPQFYTRDNILLIGIYLISAFFITLFIKYPKTTQMIIYLFWLPTLIITLILASVLKISYNDPIYIMISAVQFSLFMGPFLYAVYLAMDFIERLLRIDKMIESILKSFIK